MICYTDMYLHTHCDALQIRLISRKILVKREHRKTLYFCAVKIAPLCITIFIRCGIIEIKRS